MAVYILLSLSLFSLLVVVGVFGVQAILLKRGKITRDHDYNGPEALRLALFALLRILVRRAIAIKRLIGAYGLHVVVLGMRFIDTTTSKLYARSRNLFVKSAIKHKGTVPHFWEYLKTYKQEIDKEKEENE